MSDTNNTSTLEQRERALKDGNIKVSVNSIQRSLFVERLHIDVSAHKDLILPYDVDNLYPNKIKSIAQRSGTTTSAIETLSSFLSGRGFKGMETVVNKDGKTFWDILRFVSLSKAMFKGFALHFNYNLLGEIIEITPINFEWVRWSKNLKTYIVNPDWKRRHRRAMEQEEYNPFNPNSVIQEINAVGLENYKGQLYYWIPNLADYYTTCTFDPVLDDAQFEAEAKLYSLSSIQNDYSLGGIVSYPTGITDEGQIEDIKEDLQGDKGSINAGGIRVVGALPHEGLSNFKWFHPISRNNIDGLHKNQKEDAKNNIYAEFRQPPILNGVSQNGMFNEASFADAFHYYNSATETERDEIQRELNKIISKSIWAGLGIIKIEPKIFHLRANEGQGNQQNKIQNG